MKKEVIVGFLLCLITELVYSQEYEYVAFPNANAIWSEYYGKELVDSYFITYDKIALNGEDTLINQQSYKKLYLFEGTTFDVSMATYLGGIREEDKKIYYLGNKLHDGKPFAFDTPSEILLYDFNVNIGDRLNCDGELLANFYGLVVETIDTISIGSTLRKRISFEYSNAKWIEGIGSVQGLLFAGEPIATRGQPTGDLICFKLNDEIHYFNESFDECMPSGVSENEFVKNALIFPNPTNDEINIVIPENFISRRISVFDIYGKMMKSEYISTKNIVINLNNLPTGIYVVKIQGENSTLNYKVLKN